MHKRLILATLAAALLVACNRNEPPPTPANTADAPQTALGRQIESAMQKARKELRTGNISLGEHVHVIGVGNKSRKDAPDGAAIPKGEITPAGDLLIDGKPVAIDAAQRALLLEYRGHVIAIAEAGMALGVRGADLGMEAAGEAIRGIFSGNPDQIEKRIEQRAAGIEAEAEKLCDRLPAMRATQDRLAASLPAFKPYARMDQSDIDNCHTSSRDVRTREQVRDEIREAVRGDVRDGVREAVRGAAQAAVGVDPTPDAGNASERGAGNAAEQAEADSARR